jgi:hypothetical protein
MSHTSDLEQDYQQYHLQLLRAFIAQIEQQPPFVLNVCTEEDQIFLTEIKALAQEEQNSSEFLNNGQQLLCRTVAGYPHLMPLLYRDLLWFFGGDCLHFMPDDEIARFQLLDELRHEAALTSQTFSYENERAKVLGFH